VSAAHPGGTWGRVISVAALVAIACLAPRPNGAAAAAPLQRGLADQLFSSSSASTRSLWLDRAKSAKARMINVFAVWSVVAPARPPTGSDPASPSNPAYHFAGLDEIVRNVSAHGLQVVLTVGGAPSWAEGGGRPSTSVAPTGTWRPDPVAFGNFAHAVAARYSGQFPDPTATGAALPRVRYFQIWNEPNLTDSLTPQWNGSTPASPSIYRGLLNSAYAGIHAVSPDNRVLAPALAPFGDQPGEDRIRPLVFLRSLMCLNRKLRSTHCGEVTHLDVVTHHPINLGPPTDSAGNPNDVTVPDLGRIERVVRAATRARTLRPRGSRPFWVTEFWWASRPPGSFGEPARIQARRLEQALYLFWRQGVDAAIWLNIGDPPQEGTFGVDSGLYYADGTAKPALTAYRFPFVADRPRGRRGLARVWGIAPAGGTVRIQRLQSGAWRTLKRIHRARAGTFTTTVAAPRGTKLRARIGAGSASLVWRQR
jgi:hypothetical protein